MKPTISIVMTVYNEERFIREAIDSILNQTFSNFEFIIIDNASTDGTREIISSYNDTKIIFIKNEEVISQAEALNIGIKLSEGEFIARMDADDVSLPERLELQYKFLKENSSVAVVGTWHEEIDENGRHLKFFKLPTDPLEIKCYLISPGGLGYYCISHPTVFIRREVLFEMGFYNENFRTQDYELWVRIVRKYNLANINKFLLKRRVLKAQQSKQFKTDVNLECEKIINSNILYYLPSLDENRLKILTKMLQFKPQETKEEGRKAIGIFELFFDKYLDGQINSSTKMIKDKITLFYLLQLLKTNSFYSFNKIINLFLNYPEFLFNFKFYRKAVKALLWQ